MADLRNPWPGLRGGDAWPWLAGALALALGLGVYALDRPAGGAWFGAAGGWLPALLHTLAFTLFTAALAPPGPRAERGACAAWVLVGALFEAGQHPALAAGLGDALGGYFSRGRFDPADLGATLAGGLLAAVLLHVLRRGRSPQPWRGWAWPVALLGLGSLVGSGGGAGFPPCEGPYCGGETPPPVALVQVEPARQMVAAGAEARFRVTVQNLSGTLSYRWRVSRDGGQSFVDLTTTASDTLALPAVPLADDDLRLAVQVTSSGGLSAVATARLLVNASPGLVHEDTEFADADWIAEPYVPPGGTPAAHAEAQVATGGNPGAWRRMRVTVPPGQSSVAVAHRSAVAVHDPALDGAVRVLDWTEQCTATVYTDTELLVEQGGRQYASRRSFACPAGAGWPTTVRHLALGPEDLTLLGSEPCPAGEACPDFSASGAPLRFGYRRLLPAMPGAAGESGIDNWRVTVWRR